MGLYNWLRTAATGVDLEEEAARTERLNRINSELDEQRYKQSFWTEEEVAIVKEQRAKDWAEWAPESYAAQVNDAAAEGAVEGLTAMQDAVKGTVNSVVAVTTKGVLGFIPWWVFVGAAAYLALRLGLLKGIKLPALR